MSSPMSATTNPGIHSRPYQGEADFERIRQFLSATYARYGRQFNWQLDRWEVARYAGQAQGEITGVRPWEADIRLWETGDGDLVGAVNPEGRDDFFLQIHPDYRRLEDEMLAWAEAHVAARAAAGTGTPVLTVYALQDDALRGELLTRRGYVNRGPAEVFRSRSLATLLPDGTLPDGYRVRNLNAADPADRAKLAVTNNLTFGGTRWTPDTIRILARARTYRPDLDFVVEAPDGSVAAFCIVWYDEANRVGTFEPVGTHPDHRRRGLAAAMMVHAMRRLLALGGQKAHVNTGAGYYANALYEALGFAEFDTLERWQKTPDS